MSFKIVSTAFLTPVQNVLEKVAYFLPRHPWLGYLVAMFGLWFFSVAGAVGLYDVLRGRIDFSVVESVIRVLGLVFVVATGWYYQRHVLKMSPASLLLSLHPSGLEMTSPG
jgi:hypothetical protein